MLAYGGATEAEATVPVRVHTDIVIPTRPPSLEATPVRLVPSPPLTSPSVVAVGLALLLGLVLGIAIAVGVGRSQRS